VLLLFWFAPLCTYTFIRRLLGRTQERIFILKVKAWLVAFVGMIGLMKKKFGKFSTDLPI